MSQECFRGLADEHRRQILRLLAGRARKAGEIAAELPVSWPSVSRHLAILRSAGLITCQRDGRELRYSLDDGALNLVIAELQSLVGHRTELEVATSQRQGPDVGNALAVPTNWMSEVASELRALNDQVELLRRW